jgi:undecaprenyl-diphosphatase
VLGVVEGVTEFLPVSSTGHLLVTQRLLGIAKTEASDAYAICIQAGAIAAVLALYLGRLRQMGAGLIGRDAEGRRLALALLGGLPPAAVVGLLFDAPIERALFGPWPVVAAWLAGGLAILALSRRTPRRARPPLELTALRPGQALLIGLAQVLALWPGTSRSLVTLLAAGLVGMSLPAAIEFSFLLGLVTLGAATGYKLLQHGSEMLSAYGAASLAAGFAAAAVAALLAVRWMVAYLARHDLTLFAWWRIVAALAGRRAALGERAVNRRDIH